MLGFGALNFDKLYKVPKLIAGGGDEVHIKFETGAPGGSGANTIYGLGKLGLKTGFIGAVGDDPEGKILLDSFQESHVDTTRIKLRAGIKTSIVHGFVDEKGERALYINPGANNSITNEDLDWEYITNSEFIFLTSFVDDVQLDLQKLIVHKNDKNTGPKIIFSPGALYSKRGYEDISELIEDSYLCLLNADEIKELTGQDYETGATRLIDKGAKVIAVTLGKEGCYLTDGTETYRAPARDIDDSEVIDTTGAGDAFATGFIFGLINKKPLLECGILGNYVAAGCIRQMGARTGLPTIDEIKKLL